MNSHKSNLILFLSLLAVDFILIGAIIVTAHPNFSELIKHLKV